MFIFLCGYLGKTQAAAIALLAGGVGVTGLNNAGIITNMIDLAPRFSGVLMGLCNTVGTVPGMIGPVIAEAIVHDVSSMLLT